VLTKTFLGVKMKKLILTMMMVLVSNFAMAEETRVASVQVEARLYGGFSTDVVAAVENNMKGALRLECGSSEKVVRLMNYKMVVEMNGVDFAQTEDIQVNVEKDKYEAPLAFSLNYPKAKATATVVCKI
jgi:hypothetical protein